MTLPTASDLTDFAAINLFEAATNTILKDILRREKEEIEDQILNLTGYTDPDKLYRDHIILVERRQFLMQLLNLLDATVTRIQNGEDDDV